MSRSALVPRNDVGEYRIEFSANEVMVVRIAKKFVHHVKHPERGVGGIIFRRFTSFRKPVGQHALIDAGGKSPQDAASVLISSRDKGESGQGNHRVAAPIAKPGITRDHGLMFATRHQELVCGGSELFGERVLRWRQGGYLFTSFDFPFLE